MWKILDPQVETVRRQLAADFGCDPEEIAITRNASEALEICQLGIDLKAGDEVRARNIHPKGHTRLPRYVRGKVGVIDRDHGVFIFPDTNAVFAGKKPQHLYSVRFSAPEIWGPDAASADKVYVDMWDDYLEAD